jgi:protoporphyrinogen/coproporphyrinogen III oxidase
MNERHAVIVGGGISGLSTAFFLSQRAAAERLPLKITLLEASDRFGGVLRTRVHGDLRMEAGADAFHGGGDDAAGLCRALGLQKDLTGAAPCFRNFFGMKNRKFFPAGVRPDSFLAAARLFCDPRLSVPGKFRMALEPFISRRKETGDESLASFIRRRLGEGFYLQVAKPLVQGVYMMDPERASVEALFPGFAQAERTCGSLTGSFLKRACGKKEKGPAEFLTLKQGLEGLVQALVRELGQCDLRRSAPVRQCAYHSGWEVSPGEGAPLRADLLCLAMNACDSSKLLSAGMSDLSRELAGIRCDSIATVNLIYKCEEVPVRGPAPGFLVPMAGDRYPFSSLKWLGKTADGKHLTARAFISEAMLPEIFGESDEALGRKIRTFFQEAFGVQAMPEFMSVERYPRALPQYETGHLERVAKIEEKVRQYPGLHLTGNGFRGFGITDCIRQAKSLVASLRVPI